MPILESLTNNKYTVKDSFNFAIEIVKQYSCNFMEDLGIGLLTGPFTHISFEETIGICDKNLFIVWKICSWFEEKMNLNIYL